MLDGVVPVGSAYLFAKPGLVAGRGGVADPPLPATVAAAIHFAPLYTATDFDHLIPCVAGDAIQSTQELVSGSWDAQLSAPGRPTQRGSGSSWYAEFDGSADEFRFPSAVVPVGSAARTIGVSFRLRSLGVRHGLVSYGTNTTNQAVYIGVFDTNNKPLISQNGDSIATTGMSAYTTNVWYDLIVTVSAAGLWTVYQDGVSVGSKTMTTNTVIGESLRVGRDIGGFYAAADISRVLVDDAALTGADFTAARAWLIGGR